MNFENPFTPAQLERVKKMTKRISILVISVLLVITLGYMSFHFFTEYIWMDSLDFSKVYTTIFGTKILLAAIGFIIFSLSVFITLKWIQRTYMNHFSPGQLPPIVLNKKAMMLVIILISVLFGLFGSTLTQGLGWEPLLKFMNYEQFGQVDPHFGMDISFYMFVLPFLKFVVQLLLGLGVFYLLIVLGAYSVFGMFRKNRSAQLHIVIAIGVIGILLAFTHLLAPYGTLLTNEVNAFQTSVVHGLSYTDEFVNIPASYVLAAAVVLGVIWMIVSVVRGKMGSMIAPIIIYVGLVIVGQISSVVVQNIVVSPNEFNKEKPYLEHNLDFTRDAYQLSDIREEQHPGNNTLTAEMIERNEKTISNIRINDSRPLREVYNAKQTFRTYYNYNDVDVDRYIVDGEYQQVFLGARELNTDSLPDQAQTWVNRYLRYTHGYGVSMSQVNEITAQGQPEYMIEQIPPKGDIEITRPQIYFGEEKYTNVIGNSKEDEFDYPQEGENVSTRFDADTGIPMTTLNRFLFAIKERSFRMLVSDQITSESQYLDTRNIVERIKRIAPFFEYDDDPYIFIKDDGSLGWIIDAYLSAERYPYSEAYSGDINYIRNSVKVVVDAYTGEVNYYIVDQEDPLLQTYQNMFPDLFTEEIPEDVQAHFRYPEKLFSVQATMYGTYHMSNLEVFYNREDFWEFPTEKFGDEDITMNPYYITMRLPNEEEEEFILMIPYTPKKRQNMIAWIGVRNDGENYGDLFVYRFPKQKNVYGPQQIENRINQDSRISQQLNLWSQGGSAVIRGNLLAIPIEDTVLYVEPIYIKSSNETSLPEVKQIVLAFDEYIVMEPSFDLALEKMLGLIDSDYVPEIPEDGDVDGLPENPILDIQEQLEEFSDLFSDYQKELSDGNWEEAGRIMTEIEMKLGQYAEDQQLEDVEDLEDLEDIEELEVQDEGILENEE